MGTARVTTTIKVVTIATGKTWDAVAEGTGDYRDLWRKEHLTKRGVPPLGRRADGFLGPGAATYYRAAVYDAEREALARPIRDEIRTLYLAFEERKAALVALYNATETQKETP